MRCVDSEDSEAHRLDRSLPVAVGRSLLLVNATVHLDDESLGGAVEVDYVVADPCLTAKLQAEEPSVA